MAIEIFSSLERSYTRLLVWNPIQLVQIHLHMVVELQDLLIHDVGVFLTSLHGLRHENVEGCIHEWLSLEPQLRHAASLPEEELSDAAETASKCRETYKSKALWLHWVLCVPTSRVVNLS